MAKARSLALLRLLLNRIVMDLIPGNIVTPASTDVMDIVPEYGLVNLQGKSVRDRARHDLMGASGISRGPGASGLRTPHHSA